MTSSLVGSEMCIRDRCRLLHAMLRWALFSSRPGAAARCPQGQRCLSDCCLLYTSDAADDM
eukprot:2604890-Prorocentrum_lima.AAC.1